jgi:hypothetical protein
MSRSVHRCISTIDPDVDPLTTFLLTSQLHLSNVIYIYIYIYIYSVFLSFRRVSYCLCSMSTLVCPNLASCILLHYLTVAQDSVRRMLYYSASLRVARAPCCFVMRSSLPWPSPNHHEESDPFCPPAFHVGRKPRPLLDSYDDLQVVYHGRGCCLWHDGQ